MDAVSLLSTLAIFTLIAVLAVGVWQFVRVRKSQARRGETPGGAAGPSSGAE